MAWHDSRLRDFLRQHGAAVGGGTVIVTILTVVTILIASGDSQPPRKVHELKVVNIVPPPPPPPPPEPIQQEQPEQEMIEQPEIEEPEVKPEKPPEPDEPPPEVDADAPPGDLGLDALGEGPGDDFNLVGRPGGSGLLGGGGGGGSRWGWYASMVQAQLEEALRQNEKTRNARLRVEIRLWTDATGRISRIQLVRSTGDPEIDAVLQRGIFTGLELREPPPRDMPMPIVTRITARRPM